MANVLQIADHLEEAIKILAAYQFPGEERAELALIEIDKARMLIEEWRKKHREFVDEVGREMLDTSAKHI